MTIPSTSFVLNSAVYSPSGTTTAVYPPGTTQATFSSPSGIAVLILNNNDRYEEAQDEFDVSYGASLITITNKTGSLWPVGTRGLLQLIGAAADGGAGGASSNAHYQNVAVAAASMPVGVDMIETFAYAAPGDSGGARYKRIAGPSTSLGDFQSADGTWWQHVPHGPLRAAEYGVKGDAIATGTPDVWTGTDMEPRIRSALYDHAYGLRGAPVVLPAGAILLGRGIHIGYGTDTRSGTLKGAGTGVRFNPQWPTTTLVWNFTDEPLISVQGGRRTTIADMSISGLNADYWNSNGFGTAAYNGSSGDDTLLATWLRPTWPAQASSQYAPAAAIAVDPRTMPADGTYYYRDVAYPAELGVVTQYSKTPSSEIFIKNISFAGCGVCAVVVHPNKNSEGNGDFVRLEACQIYGAPAGISIGQTQARLNSLDRVNFAACHTAITTRLHGKQSGTFAEAWNCHFSGIQIFDFQDTSIAGHITLNFYGEEMWRIGDVRAASASSTKLILDNCKLSFACQSLGTAGVNSRGVPATMIGGGGMMPLEINGGSMVNYIGSFVIDHSVGGVTIDGTLMQPQAMASNQEKAYLNATVGGLVFARLGFTEEMGEIHPQFAFWNLDTGAAGARRMLGRRWRSSRLTCTPLWTERHTSSVAGDFDEGVAITNNRIRSLDIATFFTAISITDLVLTATVSASWNATNFQLFGPEPGDFLFHDVSKTVFVVMSRVGLIITCNQVNNYKGLVERDPISLTSGTFWCGNTRYYSPNTPVYGVIGSSTNTITDVGSVPDPTVASGGGAQVPGQLPTDIKVGDFIAVDAAMKAYLTQNNTKITAIDGTGTGLITMAGVSLAASSGGKRVRIGTFIRTAIA